MFNGLATINFSFPWFSVCQFAIHPCPNIWGCLQSCMQLWVPFLCTFSSSLSYRLIFLPCEQEKTAWLTVEPLLLSPEDAIDFPIAWILYQCFLSNCSFGFTFCSLVCEMWEKDQAWMLDSLQNLLLLVRGHQLYPDDCTIELRKFWALHKIWLRYIISSQHIPSIFL